jgi:hypothetical protein
MANHRKRFCPRGHDKDAIGAVYWYFTKTLKGTPTLVRHCKLCARIFRRNYYLKVERSK